MKLFSSDIDNLRLASPAMSGKRFVSAFLDYLFLFALGIGFFYASYAITTASSAYQNATATVQNEIAYYNQAVQETHLVRFEADGSTRVDNEIDIIKIAAKNIVLYYNDCLKNGKETGFAEKPAAAFKEAEDQEASFTSDNVAYFYTVYVPAHNDNNDLMTFTASSEATFVSLQKSAFGTSFVYFVSTGDSTLPILSQSYALALNDYLYKGLNSDVGKAVYTAFYNAYSSLFEDAENIFLNGKTYHSGRYQDYVSAHMKEAGLVADDLLIAMSVSYLCLVLLRFLLKDGRTLGNLILGLGYTRIDRSEMGVKENLLRIPLEYFMATQTSILLMGLPPFSFSYSELYVPLWSWGAFEPTLLVFFLIGMAVGFLNLGFAFFSHERRSLTDYLSKSILLDKNHVNEEDTDSPEEGPR